MMDAIPALCTFMCIKWELVRQKCATNRPPYTLLVWVQQSAININSSGMLLNVVDPWSLLPYQFLFDLKPCYGLSLSVFVVSISHPVGPAQFPHVWGICLSRTHCLDLPCLKISVEEMEVGILPLEDNCRYRFVPSQCLLGNVRSAYGTGVSGLSKNFTPEFFVTYIPTPFDPPNVPLMHGCALDPGRG